MKESSLKTSKQGKKAQAMTIFGDSHIVNALFRSKAISKAPRAKAFGALVKTQRNLKKQKQNPEKKNEADVTTMAENESLKAKLNILEKVC
jgi:hypothetical protein